MYSRPGLGPIHHPRRLESSITDPEDNLEVPKRKRLCSDQSRSHPSGDGAQTKLPIQNTKNLEKLEIPALPFSSLPKKTDARLHVKPPGQRSSSAPEVATRGSPTSTLPTPYGGTLSDSSEPTIPRATPDPQPDFPSFERKNKEQGVITTTKSVFEIMKKPIKKKDQDKGSVYIFRIKAYPGFVKIGRTTCPIQTRRQSIKRCVKHELENVDEDHILSEVPNHQRVERLIFEELREYRRLFLCPCKRSSFSNTQKFGDDDSKKRPHGEWFEIPEAKAVQVVRRWKQWILSNPYRDGKLKPNEVLRIDAYADNPDRMKSMIVKQRQSWKWDHLLLFSWFYDAINAAEPENEDWHWDHFMKFSTVYLRYLEKRHWFCGPRFNQTSDCSRFESLRSHWHSNIIFVLFACVNSTVLGSVSHGFPTVFSTFLMLNTVVMAGSAILYAA